MLLQNLKGTAEELRVALVIVLFYFETQGIVSPCSCIYLQHCSCVYSPACNILIFFLFSKQIMGDEGNRK